MILTEIWLTLLQNKHQQPLSYAYQIISEPHRLNFSWEGKEAAHSWIVEF